MTTKKKPTIKPTIKPITIVGELTSITLAPTTTKKKRK